MSIDSGSPLSALNAVITDLASRHNSFTLWQAYKGLLFGQEVKIVAVYPGYSIFQTTTRDPFPEVGKSVFLQSALLDRRLSASVVSKNPLHSRVILSGFQFDEHPWIKRSGPRVQPGRSIYAAISCGGHEITGRMIDIQAHGMAVTANARSLERAAVNPGAVIHASFQLQPGLSLKKVAGLVQNMSAFNQTLARIGIRVHAGQGLTRVLQKYIFRRQEEILIEFGPAGAPSLTLPFGSISEFSAAKKSQDFPIDAELEEVAWPSGRMYGKRN